MKNWTIRKQLNGGYVLLQAVIVLLGAFAYSRFSAVQQDAAVIVGDCLPGVYAIGKIEAEVRDAESDLRDHLLADDTAQKTAAETTLAESRERITKLMAEYDKTITRAEDRALFEKMQSCRPPYLQARDEVLTLSGAGQKREAIAVTRTKLVPAMDAYMGAVRALVDFNKRSADDYSGRINASVRHAQVGLAAGTATAVLVSVALAVFIAHRVNRSLAAIATTIRQGADHVAAAAGEVSASSQSLAGGASEQASSLEETSSSLEELASMTKRNADSAASAKTLSAETRRAAEAGDGSMGEMRTAMDAIKTSSNDIAKIIKSIDEIAFQTNILALNAAVEAARAGEAGAGFAVVAEEVRALAQRSADAAKETAAKIEVAIRNGDQGATISGKVAESLAQIVAKARQVDKLVGEIATASQEQNQGITQINGAVSQMDKVTQSTAANAEQTAAAAEELTGQSAALRNAVAELQHLIDGRNGRDATPPAAIPAPAAPRTRGPQPVVPAGATHDAFFEQA